MKYILFISTVLLFGCSDGKTNISGSSWIGKMTTSRDSIVFRQSSCSIFSRFADGTDLETEAEYKCFGDTIKIQIPEMIHTLDLVIKSDTLKVLENGKYNSLFFIKSKR